MNRVLIIGGPGSGKTTLARRLVTITHMPVHHLDAVGWENGAGAARSTAAREADIQHIAAQPHWIAEGAFIDWTDPLAEAADAIVWLDPPRIIAGWRILARHAKASLMRNNPHPGLVKLWRFLRDSCRWYDRSDPASGRTDMERWGVRFHGKVHRCRSNRDVEAVTIALS